MADKLRFLHIPKTAGSSLDDCLFAQYLGAYLLRRRFVFSGNPGAERQRFLKLSPAERRRIVLCTGHAPLHTGCPEIDALPTVTLLRHPVERVKSFCQHVSEGKSVRIHQDRSGAFDLAALLASGHVQLDNFHTRMLLGRENYRLPPGDSRELAAQAMAVLDSELACFGLTEDFERSLLLFRRVLGWRRLPVYRSRNVRDSGALLQFEQRHIDRIEELNRIDLALYDMASAEFRQRLQTRYPDIEKDLASLHSALGRPSPAFAVIKLARGVAGLVRGFPG